MKKKVSMFSHFAEKCVQAHVFIKPMYRFVFSNSKHLLFYQKVKNVHLKKAVYWIPLIFCVNSISPPVINCRQSTFIPPASSGKNIHQAEGSSWFISEIHFVIRATSTVVHYLVADMEFFFRGGVKCYL